MFLGAFAHFKWGGKYYEAEVLALSGNLYAESRPTYILTYILYKNYQSTMKL